MTDRTPCIGIDVEGRWMKAAQVAPSSRSLRLVASCRVEREPQDGLPSPQEVDELLAAIARAGCRGKRLAIASPTRDTTTAVLELPPRSAAVPIESIARMDMARAARCTPEAVETAMWHVPPPPRGGDATAVMAVALPHARARQLLELFEQGGAEVARIDLRACALARLAPDRDAGGRMLLDLGWSGLNIVLLMGDRVLYERYVADLSLSRINERLQQTLGVERRVVDHILSARPSRYVQQIVSKVVQHACEGLADELRRSIHYAHHRFAGISVAHMLVCGDGAALPGLEQSLSRSADLPVRPLARNPDATRESLFATAIGLSIPPEPADWSERP